MSVFEKQLFALKEATTDLNVHKQVCIILQVCSNIDQSKNREKVIQEYLSINLSAAINDVVCTQLISLQPLMKLIRHLIEDYNFRSYEFLPILKNILRVLIFFVQSEEFEKSQLEFFDIIAILDVLMKRFLSNKFRQTQLDDLQAIFLCLLKFIELVLSHDCSEVAVKNLLVEIYAQLLRINGICKCIANSFELIMAVANIGDEFLDRFLTEYAKDGNELWLFKILQILMRIFESFVLNSDNSNTLAVKVFESIFRKRMQFVLEQVTSPNIMTYNPELFKLCISVLNTVLWTPVFSQTFCSKILKSFVKLNGDSMVFCLSKSSTKIRKYTTYNMKIFLTALVTYSDNSLSDKHGILNVFLESRFFNSIIELKPHQVLKNYKALSTLYGCSLLRQRLANPLDAHRILENLLIILNYRKNQLEEDEIWNILKIFAFSSNYAVLSELEYAGVQRTSEALLKQASKSIIGIHKTRYPIDKNIILLAKEFSPDNTFNSLIFLYLSQQPTLASSKAGQIIPTHHVLPLLISNDNNQVENALKILQRKTLAEEEMDFIIEQCFGSLKTEEIVIGAALNLIGTHLCAISHESTVKVYRGLIDFLKAKQVTLQFSQQCYLLMVQTCVNLIRFKTKAKHVDDMT